MSAQGPSLPALLPTWLCPALPCLGLTPTPTPHPPPHPTPAAPRQRLPRPPLLALLQLLLALLALPLAQLLQRRMLAALLPLAPSKGWSEEKECTCSLFLHNTVFPACFFLPLSVPPVPPPSPALDPGIPGIDLLVRLLAHLGGVAGGHNGQGPELQLLDGCPVALKVCADHVLQQLAAAGGEHLQRALAGSVVAILGHVQGQALDALSDERDWGEMCVGG